MEINESLLDFWLEHDYNAHIEGRRGTGKTAMITAAFTRKYGTKWKYFSAPTMDPWVDFVGVPEKTKSPMGHDCLELIRPAEFADDQVYALFFDELNRAKPKVIDAVMELIQFKSINGRKFNNLKVVWCATNPKVHDGDEDEEYSVEALDPAHRDRFHIFVETDYKMNEEYFQKFYPEYADTAISWWNTLGKNSPKAQNKVSPRRMDYALNVFRNGGDIAYVLPKEVNVSSLVAQLKNGSFEKKMKELYKSGTVEEKRKALMNENFFNGTKEEILKNDQYLQAFAPYFPSEKFNNYIATDDRFQNFVLGNRDVAEAGKDNLINIVEANKANPKLVKKIRDKLTAYGLYTQTPFAVVIDNHYNELDDYIFGEDNEHKRMRIAGLIQKEDHAGALDINGLRKALTILCCVAANCSIIWPSTKIAMENIKKFAPKYSMTFKTLMEEVIKDPLYVKYVKDDSKIKTIIKDGKLREEDKAA